MKAVALSESHSLLLGASGLWAAGSNKHGACGIDTGSSLAPSPPHPNSNDFGLKRDKVLASKAGLTIPMQTTGMQREGSAISAMMAQREKAISVYLRHLMTPYIKPKVPQEVMDYRIMMQPFLIMNGKRRSSLGGLSLGPWNAIDPRMSKEVAEVLIQPDLILSPVRVGLGSFVSVSASSCYSIGCTSSGEVWSWGGTNRHQGQEDQMAGPRPLTGELAEEIRSLGGAVKVAAGLNFALALTAEGKVVAWSTDKGAEDKGFTLRDFPAISEISAGSDHALITDGARVWSMSRGVDQEGIWQSLPKEEIDLSSMGGVVSMTCGQTSSSVVSGDGGLWMWGCLLEPSHAHSLLRKKRGVAEDQPALSGDDAVVNWNGFGSIKPAKVECLSHLKVKYVALGSHHALVSVE